MNQTKKNKFASIGLILIIAGSCGIFKTTSNSDLGNEALTSKDTPSKAKVNRQTVLGKVRKSLKKPKEEVNIIMSDPALSQKWGLALTQSREAWKKSLGSRKIVVAVIDTGIDVNHPDLKNNLWTNPKEIPGNKKDDDENGFVDDVHGWNFVNNNDDLTDNHSHGTHIAGIIGAEGGNGIGISGVAPKVSLMTLKYYDPKALGQNNLNNTVRALKYAIDNNADIINYSGGGLEPSPAEKELIRQARDKGILVVAAAGNEQSNSDIHAYYPADYDFNNIISVTAIDQNQNVLPTSNYGTVSVDIAAPGNNIYSTIPGGKYGYMTGTSQATAFVTGLAVLLKAHFKDHGPDKVIRHILASGDWDQRLVGKTKTTKRLNTARALKMLDNNVGRTGVIATNSANIDHSAFATEQTTNNSLLAADPGDSATRGLSELSQAIKKLQRESKPRVKNKL